MLAYVCSATMNRRRGTAAGLAALIVLALQVVVLGNQWVNDQVFRHVKGQSLLLVYSAAAQSTWRIPRHGDAGYALVADLRAILLLVFALFLVSLVSQGPRTYGAAFVSCWGAIVIAAALAGVGYGIAGRHVLPISGLGFFTSVVQTMSAGAGYGVLGGWLAALAAAAFSGRPTSAAEQAPYADQAAAGQDAPAADRAAVPREAATQTIGTRMNGANVSNAAPDESQQTDPR